MSSAEYSCKLFKPIFAYSQTVWTQIRLLLKEQSDLGPHCLQKWLLKSQADDKVDDNSCDWRFKGKVYFYVKWHPQFILRILLLFELIVYNQAIV